MAQTDRSAKSALWFMNFSLGLFAAIVTATLMFFLSCIFEADAAIRDTRAAWHTVRDGLRLLRISHYLPQGLR